MSSLCVYRARPHSSEDPVALIVADADGRVLPQLDSRVEMETCGTLSVPVREEFSPGQRFMVRALEGRRSGRAYDVLQVYHVPESVVQCAQRMGSGNPAGFEDYIRAFLDSP